MLSRHKAQETRFYEQLPFCDVTDVFRFVNEQCRFLPAMKPLQPRYAKKEADTDSLIQPAGQIDLDLITREKSNLDRIVATLGLKEMTQGTLIRKLCTYTTTNPTRLAVFEYDRLVRSIYTLKYLRDPQPERNIRRSQNRIESYPSYAPQSPKSVERRS